MSPGAGPEEYDQQALLCTDPRSLAVVRVAAKERVSTSEPSGRVAAVARRSWGRVAEFPWPRAALLVSGTLLLGLCASRLSHPTSQSHLGALGGTWPSEKFLGASGGARLSLEPPQHEAPSGQVRHTAGLCLDVPLLQSGLPGKMTNCSTSMVSDNQRFFFDTASGIITNSAGKCLDAGGDLHLWNCDTNNANQRWDYDVAKGHHIVSRKTKLCLSAVGEDSYVLQKTAHMKPCDDSDKLQAWAINGHQISLGETRRVCLYMDAPNLAPSFLTVALCEAEHHGWGYNKEQGRIHVGEGLCLEAEAPDKAGLGLRAAGCDEKAAGQSFRYYGSGQIVTTRGGLCVDTAQPTLDGGEVHLWTCNISNPHQRWNITGADDQAIKGHAPPSKSQAPVNDFYMYRATAKGSLGKYPFGEVNTGNMDGVMWYLMNEVVTMYSGPMACPRKFGISEIHRFRVRTKATAELFSEGHNFGVRFAYDRGQCAGRCFPGNKCTCTEDCDAQFSKYGHVVGCNNFVDHYPFPDMTTQAPSGVWYSLPIDGKCDFPTGEKNCTWSVEEAGKITLQDLEAVSPGWDQCCDGHCTNFWTQLRDVGRTYWRVNEALNLFGRTYPKMPRDLPHVGCDFKRYKWYGVDNWKRVDPWDKKDGCMHERFDKHVMLPFQQKK